MQKKLTKFIVIFCLFLLFLFLSLTASAQESKLEVEYPEIGGIKPETVTTELPEYVRYVFNFSIIIAGLVLFGALIYGGVKYLTSTGNLPALIDAREQILAAFLGIIILLSSYIILTTINPQLIVFNLPELEKAEILCRNNDDCLGDFICIEEKCVEAPCKEDKDCLGFPDYVCKLPEGVCVYEGRTLIVYEIPLGRIIDEGVWEEDRTKETEDLIKDFEKFLKEEIKVNPTFNQIADLNKYLKTLTEECQCGNLDAFCTKPWEWSMSIGCSGDPCKEKLEGTIGGIVVGEKTTREKMEEVLKINEEKMKKLLEFMEEIKEKKTVFENQLNKFSKGLEDVMDCLKQSRELYTFKEHLARVQYYEDIGWNVKIVPGILEAKADPFTFYCSVGGPIMDYPYLSEVEFSPEEFEPVEIPEKVEKPEPMSCPIGIPISVILEQSGGLGVALINKMDGLIFWIDEMNKEIRNMADLVSQCNEQNCKINCACIPNPCFGSLLPWCWFFSPASRCLQAIGQCSGDPCPYPEIGETSEKIKKNEDEIFLLLEEIKEIFPKVNEIVKVGTEDALDLKDITWAVEFCSGPVTETEPPTWFMSDCSMVLGSYGPGGQVIGDCHPWDFFCCTQSKEALREVPSLPPTLRKLGPRVGPEGPEEPTPSELAKSSIPAMSSPPLKTGEVSCLKQSDPRWGNKLFGPCLPGGTYADAGCGPSSLAMAISYFQNKEILVDTIGEKIVEKGLRNCDSGSSPSIMTVIPSLYGLSSYEIRPFAFENWKEEVKKCFDEGGLITALMAGPSKFTAGSGHFIALTDITDDYAYITVNDSSKRICPRQEPLKDVFEFKKQPGIWCIKK